MDIPDIVSSPPTRSDRVRAIALMAKKAGMSDEAFFKHWQEIHGPLFANLDIVKKNILKYEQVSILLFAFHQEQPFTSVAASLYCSI